MGLVVHLLEVRGEEIGGGTLRGQKRWHLRGRTGREEHFLQEEGCRKESGVWGEV